MIDVDVRRGQDAPGERIDPARAELPLDADPVHGAQVRRADDERIRFGCFETSAPFDRQIQNDLYES